MVGQSPEAAALPGVPRRRPPAARTALMALAAAFAGWVGHAAPGVAVRAAQRPDETAAPVAFRIIVTSSPDRADQLAARVRRGEEFAILARAESLDPSSSRGGLIGPVALSDLREELRDALRALSPGSVSGVLVIPTGYALVQRVDVSTATAAAGSEALAAAGAIRSTISVDGVVEVQTALARLDKPADWNLDPQLICRMREQSIEQVVSSLSQVLADGAIASSSLRPQETIDVRASLAQFHAFSGDMEQAVREHEEALRLARLTNPASVPDHEQATGIAHVHKAEMDNGLYRAPGDRCLLSTTTGPPLSSTEAFAAGERHLLALLDRSPEDLEARWLLNAAHMATGGYPGRVPARYLIPPATFASTEDVGRFVDVAEAAGLRSFSMAGGVVVDDFDNDGLLDVLTSNADHCAPLQLFRREPDGLFVERTAEAGLADQLGGLNVNQADYDNDGCMDVLVMRGGWELPQRRSLLHNNCDGTFTDVTAKAGLLTPVTSSQTAAWADFDNDGWVDLFVGNENTPAQLFHNQHDGTFVDIAAEAGVQRTSFTKAVAAGDIDNDGFTDVYLSNFRGGNLLYRNNGDRTFTEVSAASGVSGADRGFPAWFFDVDNDGWEDLFAASYVLSIEESARSYLGLPLNAGTLVLHRNTGGGRFRDATTEAGLRMALMPMGANFGDIDNDGFLDIYLGTGSPSYVSLVPSLLLRNRGGQSFVDVTMSSGTGEMHKGHGVAFADLDHDGDAEIIFKVGGATPGDAHAFRLFENPGHGHGWLGVKLVGTRSNRAGIGARIAVTVEDGGARRTIHRTVTSGGSFGASPLEQHIGLGSAVRIVELDVRWPASGTRQTFRDVSRNQVIEIREMAGSYTRLNRPPLPLGGRRAQ